MPKPELISLSLDAFGEPKFKGPRRTAKSVEWKTSVPKPKRRRRHANFANLRALHKLSSVIGASVHACD